jgi:hypothetical protein
MDDSETRLACSTQGEKRNTRLLQGSLKERGHLEDQGIYGDSIEMAVTSKVGME